MTNLQKSLVEIVVIILNKCTRKFQIEEERTGGRFGGDRHKRRNYVFV